jgi:proteasome lid subunit RPN8/RPN11
MTEDSNATKDNNLEQSHKEDQGVYKVYILHRVVSETLRLCKKTMPKEAIGILLGYKYQYKGVTYVKVVDWVTGRANQSHAFAEFTPEGVRQYTTLIDEKYGDAEERPRIVGIFHSHPFGSNPHFSSTDYNTFLNFPYDALHNVFVLIDPKSLYYKSYIVVINEENQKDLLEVDWVEYTVR